MSSRRSPAPCSAHFKPCLPMEAARENFKMWCQDGLVRLGGQIQGPLLAQPLLPPELRQLDGLAFLPWQRWLLGSSGGGV